MKMECDFIFTNKMIRVDLMIRIILKRIILKFKL